LRRLCYDQPNQDIPVSDAYVELSSYFFIKTTNKSQKESPQLSFHVITVEQQNSSWKVKGMRNRRWK